VRFRKRPVEIEAMQWDGTADGATQIINWILDGGSTATFQCSNPDRCAENDGDTPHSIAIDTLEGTMRAGLGDWIIRGVKGEFYPCKPGIFASTYEPVADKPDIAGRVIITWPAPTTAGVLNNTHVRLTDADTGEHIVSAFKLSLVLGTDEGYEPALIEADVTAIVDENGAITNDANRAYDRETGRMRTGVFRYLVAEMRVAD
jgi:hypothetical protein